MPEHYITAGGKRLRCGRTTGTCAAMAAAGAVRLLLTGRAPDLISLNTPRDWMVEAPLLDLSRIHISYFIIFRAREQMGGHDQGALYPLRRHLLQGTGHIRDRDPPVPQPRPDQTRCV